jgi:hypothetical protein
MRRSAALLLAAFLIAGCGGTAAQTPPRSPPKIPRALAQQWEAEAQAVAAALASGDGCNAKTAATGLREQIIEAVNAHSFPSRYQATLLGAVNDLPDKIVCTPAPPTTTDEHPKPPKHGHGKHDKGGNG